MRTIKFLLLLPLMSACAVPRIAKDAVIVPAGFVDKGRFYLKLPALNGDTLTGFADTGGGGTFLYPHTIDRLAIAGKIKQGGKGSRKQPYILFADVIKANTVPSPAVPFDSLDQKPYFTVMPNEALQGEGGLLLSILPHDVFLGQHFFLGKSWTFDYPNERVYTNTPVPKNRTKSSGIQKLGFKKNAAGQKLYGHPSMQIEVSGETIDVLLDTGATIILSDTGRKQLGTEKTSLAGSFIARSVYDRWVAQHPAWKVIEKGEANADLIEVPQVKIGNSTVGPVLFAVRPDQAWSRMMIHSMDKVVKGAIGGSAFQYLVVTVDYNSELARFTTKTRQ
ncbi:retroviral-like aspartic protease family protein [Hymenobacter sp. BT175]|uniref:retroviral-like aspartic protease family protein n=1 Tax=Hymenobacter translucens TaxID=2886507 RepID=UPI001D0E455A|nr:retroviral-like aspartic protease family protein [Hymenobacter translucens]MCC2545498.1 retroviral-like aspartic protease family protein [Hymenobacter translucens]